MNGKEKIDKKDLSEVMEIKTAIISEINKVIIGKSDVIEYMLVALLADGHVLMEGVPGIAKTTLVKAFSNTLGLSFRRIQFTPDLIPSDITGNYIYNMKTGEFYLRKGPIFANVILADEINRAPPKTQAALLEAMQEKQITIEGETRLLSLPFMVFATQNPIEQSGTYPLPEAQLDRFLMRLVIQYPSKTEEKEMLRTNGIGDANKVRQILNLNKVCSLQKLIPMVYCIDEIFDYITTVVEKSRQSSKITLGASPRATLAILNSAKAYALLNGRDYVIPDDVNKLIFNLLNHRIILKPEVEMSGATVSQVLKDIVNSLDVLPRK